MALIEGKQRPNKAIDSPQSTRVGKFNVTFMYHPAHYLVVMLLPPPLVPPPWGLPFLLPCIPPCRFRFAVQPSQDPGLAVIGRQQVPDNIACGRSEIRLGPDVHQGSLMTADGSLGRYLPIRYGLPRTEDLGTTSIGRQQQAYGDTGHRQDGKSPSAHLSVGRGSMVTSAASSSMCPPPQIKPSTEEKL